MTQTALAERVGVQRSAVAQWEHHTGSQPSIQHLIAVAECTGVSLEWLGTGRGSPERETPLAPGLWIDSVRALNDTEATCLRVLRRMSPQVRNRMVALLIALEPR